MLDHTNIIKYVECFEDARYIYIVTEFVPNSRELGEIILKAEENWNKNEPLLPLDGVCSLMHMVMSGV